MKTEVEVTDLLKSEDINYLCRICLTDITERGMSLFEIRDSLSYSAMVMLCTRVHIAEDDGLPSMICDVCSKELTSADQFRVKCENSDALLKRIHLKSESKISIEISGCGSALEIKDEIGFLFDDKAALDIKDIAVAQTDEDADYSPSHSVPESNGRVKRRKKKKRVGSREQRLRVKDFSCSYCSKSLSSMYSLRIHIQNVHGPEKGVAQVKVSGTGKDRVFYCSFCDYTTNRKPNLICHERKHTGTRPYKCDQCDASFTQPASRNRHKKTHSDKMYFTCPECGKQFKYREGYLEHRTVHTNERKYICSICNKGLKSRTALDVHRKRHLNIRNFTCESCGKTFITRLDLTMHSRTHTVVEKNFHCNICGYAFDTKAKLELHVKRHTGERAFKCELCQYCSHTKSELKMHMMRHTKEKNHECSNCEYSSHTLRELKVHMIRHTKGNNYQCSVCEMKYRHNASLRRHMFKAHGKKYKSENDPERKKCDLSLLTP